MGLPVDTRASGISRALVDGLDQCAADPLASRRFVREQVLQVAGRPDLNGAAMKEVVRQPEKPSTSLGNQRMDGFIGVEEARPGHPRDLGRERVTPIKTVV